MLNLQEYLLICLGEECNEIGKRAAKANRFGLDETQPGQEFTNRVRLDSEIDDFRATLELLDETCGPIGTPSGERIRLKREKLARYADYSRELGRLEP